MSRRFGHRTNPFYALDADFAWRAEDAYDNGSVTTVLAPYIGEVSLTKDAAGQAIKAGTTNFQARKSISFDGLSGGYSAALLSSAPPYFTVASVLRFTAANSGMYALSAGGVVNTGNSAYYDAGGIHGRKVVSDAVEALAHPLRLVIVVTLDSDGVTLNANRYATQSTAAAGALAGTVFTIGALDSSSTFTLAGEWVETGCWLRKLRASEIRYLMTDLGAEHEISIAA